MKIEDKKKLAVDLMGWKIDEGYTTGLIEYYCSFVKPNKDQILAVDYNPDTDPTQFKEVVEKMTDEIEDKTATICERRFPGQEDLTGRIAWLWISNHMPEVITAILEILK